MIPPINEAIHFASSMYLRYIARIMAMPAHSPHMILLSFMRIKATSPKHMPLTNAIGTMLRSVSRSHRSPSSSGSA